MCMRANVKYLTSNLSQQNNLLELSSWKPKLKFTLEETKTEYSRIRITDNVTTIGITLRRTRKIN